jgi:hypothetical protein
MKQKMKTIFRILTLMFLISFTSCNDDENNQTTQNTKQSNFNIRKLNKQEILQKSKVIENLNQIKDFKNKLSTSKIVYDSIYNFFINTDEALYIADGISESYTFPVYRSSSSSVVENLVIYIKDNQSLVYLIDYGHNIDELQNMSQAQLEQNDVKHYLIDLNPNAFLTGKIDAPHSEHICLETYTSNPLYGNCTETHSNGETCSQPQYILSSSVCQWITTGAGGGNDSSSESESTGPTGSGPTGGSTTTGSNTANSNGDPIINTTFYSPCSDCFEMTEEISIFLNSLDANQLSYWNNLENRTKISIVSYLDKNDYSLESVEFVEELFVLAYQNQQITIETILSTIQEKQNDSSLNLQQAFTLAIVNNTVNPTTGDPVELYLLLKYKNSSFFDSSSFSIINNSINVGAYTLTPHYKSNNTLVYYTAVRYSGSSTLHDIEYIIKPTGLSSFQQQISLYTYAADLFYMNGIPSDGQIAFMAGDYFVGLSQMWNDAVHSPQWWAYAITCFGHAIVALPNNTSVSSTITTQQWRVSMKRLTNNAFQGKTVTNPQGVSVTINIPDNYVPRIANSGQGIVFVPQGTPLTSEANAIRIMEPITTGTYPHPKGYVKFYNSNGQPINPNNGQTLGNANNHFDFH